MEMSKQFTITEQMEIDEFCAEFGSDVKAADERGLTSLHHAAYVGSVVVAEVLVLQGADVDAKDYRCYTPLHVAASKGNVGVAEYLISEGADINAKDRLGRTPLDIARQGQSKDTSMVQCLSDLVNK